MVNNVCKSTRTNMSRSLRIYMLKFNMHLVGQPNIIVKREDSERRWRILIKATLQRKSPHTATCAPDGFSMHSNHVDHAAKFAVDHGQSGALTVGRLAMLLLMLFRHSAKKSFIQD